VRDARNIVTTVNAPYGTGMTAAELARRLADPGSLSTFDPCVFAFLSEVKPGLQASFVEEMRIDREAVREVAEGFAAKCGFPLFLASRDDA
jgi:hypothetical protein